MSAEPSRLARATVDELLRRATDPAYPNGRASPSAVPVARDRLRAGGAHLALELAEGLRASGGPVLSVQGPGYS